MSENEKHSLTLIDKGSYFRVFTDKYNPKEKIIKNHNGTIIADDATSYNIYINTIYVEHKNGTKSLFNKNGTPLTGAYRSHTLDIMEVGMLGVLKYRSEGEKIFKTPYKKILDYASVTSTCFVLAFGALMLKSCVQSFNGFIEKIEAEKAITNRQKATLLQLQGDMALFDVNGNKKTDYTAHHLTIPDKVFLMENMGQTKTIGSWKDSLSNRAIFMKYNRPQNER